MDPGNLPYNPNFAPGGPPGQGAAYPPTGPYPPAGAAYPPAGAGPYPPAGAAPPFNMPQPPVPGAGPFVPPPYPAGAVPPPGVPGQAPAMVSPPTMNMGPINSPAIPMITAVPRPLKDGQTIHIVGSVPANPTRFHINLSLGSGLNQKVGTAMHMNARWDDGEKPCVVRNSYLKNSWGKEERWGDYFPLTAGQPFECIILVQSDCYKIAFNGHHFCEYKHRTPKDQVSHLVIEGSVAITTMYSLLHGGAGGQPAAGVPAMPPPMPGPAGTTPPQPVKVPCKREIPGALYPGKMIYISGTPKSSMFSYDSFCINLGSDPKMNKNIAFHFNPRYKEKTVIRNTMPGFSWGREEKSQPEFPFLPGKHFDIIILVEKEEYKVAVNGKHFITYQHRLRNLAQIKHIEIKGDVTISNLTL